MTRLPDGVSRASLRRIATSARGDLVVVLNERNITIKPKGNRKNGVVTVTWGAVYERQLLAELSAAKRAKQNARRARRKA